MLERVSPTLDDVVIIRLDGAPGVRWRVMRGGAQVFESSSEPRARAEALSIALSESARCVLSDQHGVRLILEARRGH
jgi:hypothetical protein